MKLGSNFLDNYESIHSNQIEFEIGEMGVGREIVIKKNKKKRDIGFQEEGCEYQFTSV